jgi:hypothetical protein
MKKRAKVISQSRLYAFVKARMGRGPASGESLLELAAQALADMGVERAASGSARKFLEANRDSVIAVKVSPIAPVARAIQLPAVATDAFLSTYEWRRVRMVALKKYGSRCQCCGATPATGAVMNVDHIKPRKIFPDLALEVANLQVLCHDCNHGKGNWDMTDWRGAEAVVP